MLLLLLVMIPIFTYAQYKLATNIQEQMGTTDWKLSAQEQVQDYTNRINSPRMLEEWKTYYKIEVERLQYHIDNNVDPRSPNGVTFTRVFLENSIGLLLPLLVLVIVSDLVSSEFQQGTIKILVTRPVKRWKVLTSKFIALTFYVSLTVFSLVIMAYLISGAIFGYGGFDAPVFMGFQQVGSSIDTNGAYVVEQWQFLWMSMGLAWFSSMVVGCLALMVSILIRSTAAGMGVMVSTLIAGTILANMAASWESAKYFFMINLNTIVFLSGQKPPVPGMDLSFSLINLSLTGLAAIIVSYAVFTKQDIYN